MRNFQKFYPLNSCKMCSLSESKKTQCLANMAGGVAVPSQTRVFFLWQFLKYVVWRCHAENIFCHQTSLERRLRTQVFLVECGTWWCSMWCFPGAAPHILRLLSKKIYFVFKACSEKAQWARFYQDRKKNQNFFSRTPILISNSGN